jgi:hypothetical protein
VANTLRVTKPSRSSPGLRDPTRTLAFDYIRKAPEEVVTPVRTAAQGLLR